MSEFADVLRAWRSRIDPREAGLPVRTGRRTTGLRREELAALAGVSVDYIVRLEQGRAQHPSPQLLTALTTALRLTTDERDHLFRAAGAAVPEGGFVPRHITPGVQRIVDRLGDVPMAVFTATHDFLLWNPLWAALNGDPGTYAGLERNLVWRIFMVGHDGVDFDAQHEEDFAADLAADLRSAYGRYPSDRDLNGLVTKLRAESPAFEQHWLSARVAEHRASKKTITGNPAGPITLDCDILTVPGSDLRVVVYTAAPGSPDSAKLDLLRVTGLQRL